MLKGLIAKQDYKQVVLGTVSSHTGFRLEKVLVGYKAELDRAGSASVGEQDDRDNRYDDILTRARSNGVEVIES